MVLPILFNFCMLEECIGVPPPVDMIMFEFEFSIFFKIIDSCSLKNDSPYLSKISAIFKLNLLSISRSVSMWIIFFFIDNILATFKNESSAKESIEKNGGKIIIIE